MNANLPCEIETCSIVDLTFVLNTYMAPHNFVICMNDWWVYCGFFFFIAKYQQNKLKLLTIILIANIVFQDIYLTEFVSFIVFYSDTEYAYIQSCEEFFLLVFFMDFKIIFASIPENS